MRSSKHENDLFFWKFTLLNVYMNIYNIEQMKNIKLTLSNEVFHKTDVFMNLNINVNSVIVI